MLLTTLSPLLLLVAKVSAAGCKGSMTYGFCDPDRIVRYYDPEDGQICPMRDCGGGRAPPKTTDPCCNAYKGTETCDPNPPPTYMPCFSQLKASSTGSKPSTAAASATTTPAAPSSTPVVTRSSPGSSAAPTPSATSSGGEAPQSSSQSSASGSGGEAPQATSAPAAGGNGTVTTSPPNGASSGTSSSSAAAAPAQASNAAGALRYDLMGAIAGFVGVNAFALV